MKPIDYIISEAKVKLTDNPFDAGHDLIHTEAVWATAQDLVNHLNQSVDLGALKIACYWHDVVVKPQKDLKPAGGNVGDTTAFLKKRLEVLKFPQDFTTLTVNAVRFHQFDAEPVNLEGQILWDADKLEAINVNRWLEAKKAVEEGKMPQSKLDAYTQTAMEWLKVLRPKYHFDYSRQLFDQRVKTLFSHPEILSLARKQGINLNEL